MQTIAILNYKGGVGKTTLAACVAQALALTGARVLAIDNDYQHNLTSMLGQRPGKPNLRDVYLSSVGVGGKNLEAAILTTAIPELHVATANTDLSNIDVRDPFQLKKCIDFCRLDRKYDYIIIDNSPGLDRLQEAALHAATSVFVPTELSHFGIGGIYEMHRTLAGKFKDDCQITRVVPYFYRKSKQQDAFLRALNLLFPGKVTATTVPYDPVFENLIDQQKVLFLHRISSQAAFCYVELLSDLFGLDGYTILTSLMERQSDWFGREAQIRLKRLQEKAAHEPQVKVVPVVRPLPRAPELHPPQPGYAGSVSLAPTSATALTGTAAG